MNPGLLGPAACVVQWGNLSLGSLKTDQMKALVPGFQVFAVPFFLGGGFWAFKVQNQDFTRTYEVSVSGFRGSYSLKSYI